MRLILIRAHTAGQTSAKNARALWARTAPARTPGPPIREGGFRVVVAANLFALAADCTTSPPENGTSPAQILIGHQ
ncbi:MAG TPA: hypothetical protein VFT45_10805, partial [Longimicrobium sp.]|nr:hypothetical protein [Longimicrobium sp.]